VDLQAANGPSKSHASTLAQANRLTPCTHAVDRLDAEQLEATLELPSAQRRQGEAASPDRGLLGLQHRALLVKAAERAGQRVKVVAQKMGQVAGCGLVNDVTESEQHAT